MNDSKQDDWVPSRTRKPYKKTVSLNGWTMTAHIRPGSPPRSRAISSQAADLPTDSSEHSSLQGPTNRPNINNKGQQPGSTMSGAKALPEIEKELECSICCDMKTAPKIVGQCYHTFCRDCIDKYIKSRKSKGKTKTNSFPCPHCRSRCALPSEGVDGLKDDFTAANIIEHLRAAESTPDLVAVPKLQCRNCKVKGASVDASFVCDACDFDLCEACKDDHLIKAIPQGDHLIYQICSDHERRMKHYCVNCNMLVCAECMDSHDSNASCQIKPYKSVASDMLVDVSSKVAAAVLLKQTADIRVAKAQESAKETETKSLELRGQILPGLRAVRSEVEALDLELKKLMASKQKKIAEEKKLENLLKDIEKCCEENSAETDSYWETLSAESARIDAATHMLPRLLEANLLGMRHKKQVTQCRTTMEAVLSSLAGLAKSVKDAEPRHLPDYPEAATPSTSFLDNGIFSSFRAKCSPDKTKQK